MNDLQHLLTYSIPAVILLATIEAFVLSWLRKGDYDWRSYFASMADALVRQYLVYVFLPLSLAAPLIGWAWSHRLTTLQIDSLPAFLLFFLGLEFCYYWFHRAAHRVRWFWATHGVHHSTNGYNLSVAYRFGWTGALTGMAVFYVPLIWIGFSPAIVFTSLSLNLLYQFWLHVDWIPRLGVLEWVLNTPSHHRVHHAANAEYIDGNYGGVLIVFDRLFGTFKPERADLPCRYGLVEPLTSNNPLKIAFHAWGQLFRDIWKARSWRERLTLPFSPP